MFRHHTSVGLNYILYSTLPTAHLFCLPFFFCLKILFRFVHSHITRKMICFPFIFTNQPPLVHSLFVSCVHLWKCSIRLVCFVLCSASFILLTFLCNLLFVLFYSSIFFLSATHLDNSPLKFIYAHLPKTLLCMSTDRMESAMKLKCK